MNLIKTFEMLSRMADVRRYSMVRLTTPESVLEHTAFVALLSYLISTEINLFYTNQPIQMDWVLAKALVHDVEEIVTGDIPRPTKYHSSETRAMFKMIEDEGTRRVLDDLEILPLAIASFNFFRDRAKIGPSGIIVAIADTLAVVYKSWDEVLLRNNMSMAKVAASTLPDLARLRSEVANEFACRPSAVGYLEKIISDAEAIATEASNHRRE